MSGLLVKLLVCPAVVYIASVLFGDVQYPAVSHPVLVGLVLAVTAHTMELFVLKPGTLWISSALDFVAATAIVYFSAFVIPGAAVTIFGALMTAFLLTLTEIPQHQWLIKSGKTTKA